MYIEKVKFLWETIDWEGGIPFKNYDMANQTVLDDHHGEGRIPLEDLYRGGQIPVENREWGMLNP